MSLPAVKARLKFLAASAQLYSSTAPATSAHLMLECKAVATANNIVLKESESKQACSACGTILVPGWSLRTTIVDSRRSKKFRSKSGKEDHSFPREAQKLVLSECLVCHRLKRTPLMCSSRHNDGGRANFESHPASSTSAQTVAETGVTNPKTQGIERASANLSSKRRAKSRKSDSLQALLEKSRAIEATSSGVGLDLMDMMKT